MKEQLTQKTGPILDFIRKYAVFTAGIVLLGLYGFLIFSINNSIQAEPSEDAVAERLKTVQRPRVDQKTLNKIQELQDQHIQVQSLFDDARNNPFQE